MKKILIIAGVLMGLMCCAAPVQATGDAEVKPAEILENNKSICDDDNGIPDDLKEAAGCNLKKEDTAMPIAITLIEVALSVVGILTVGMIIYGGIFYVISNGDAAKLQRAKNTILYGIVGLVVSLLAFAIVTFVSKSIWG